MSRTGSATAAGGGDANTGAVASPSDGVVSVGETGDARAEGVSADTGYRGQG
ncbi:hypothetical protein [Streptomyces olivaceus]|uniref:hypothetical protein n=1 Tax=Streptomyces olivaceus TaxID=47716 RepID=UPI0036CC6CE5